MIGRDANDGVRLAVDHEGLAENIWRTAEGLLPEAVGENGDPMIFVDLFLRREVAPETDPDPKHVEMPDGGPTGEHAERLSGSRPPSSCRPGCRRSLRSSCSNASRSLVVADQLAP